MILGKVDGNGGGIDNSGTLTVTNTTLSGNESSYGGGIYNTQGTAMTNTTLSGNKSSQGGGGLTMTSNPAGIDCGTTCTVLQDGDGYDQLKPTYAIWLLGETLRPKLKEAIHRFRLRDEQERSLLDHGGIWLLEFIVAWAGCPCYLSTTGLGCL